MACQQAVADMIARVGPASRDRDPAIFGYARCSHADGAASGLGIVHQEMRIQQAIALIQQQRAAENLPPLMEIPIARDEAQSAFRLRFAERPGGVAIFATARKDDHVIFTRVEQTFRSMKDMVLVLDQFRQRGVVVHWTDEAFDESTPLGRAMLQLAGVFAELYSRFTSARTKEALARKYNSVLPRGPSGGTRWYEVHEVLRNGARITDSNIGRVVLALHEQYALNDRQISEQLRYWGQTVPDPCLQLLRRWSKRRVISVRQAAKEGRQCWSRRPKGLRGQAYGKKKAKYIGLDDFETVQAFMQAARGPKGWEERMGKVAVANGGCLPDWWREAITDSGIEEIVKARFRLHPQKETDH
jgi:DNA invertase Pin-like site-specific DNA recombinase